MSFTQQLTKTFEKEYAKEKGFADIYRQRLIEFRKEKESAVRVERPTNLARARTLGYKAKQGFVVVRVRVRKGGGVFHRPAKGRRPKRMGVTKLTRNISIQTIAEQRASEKYPNLEVLNSYWVGEDGQKKYYEIIMVDTSNPSILADRNVNWICKSTQRGRVERGLTSSAKKARGLRNKGRGAEKASR